MHAIAALRGGAATVNDLDATVNEAQRAADHGQWDEAVALLCRARSAARELDADKETLGTILFNFGFVTTVVTAPPSPRVPLPSE